jgi:hypothetical protein
MPQQTNERELCARIFEVREALGGGDGDGFWCVAGGAEHHGPEEGEFLGAADVAKPGGGVEARVEVVGHGS